MLLDRDAVLEIFVAETEETLGQMEAALLLLEERPADDELLGELFRVMHMLQGNAAALEFTKVSSVAHSIEDLLSSLRNHDIAVDGEIVNLLLQAVGALRRMVSAASISLAITAAATEGR
jgi:two-component system chemotaxis sensor kinase CheA